MLRTYTLFLIAFFITLFSLLATSLAVGQPVYQNSGYSNKLIMTQLEPGKKATIALPGSTAASRKIKLQQANIVISLNLGDTYSYGNLPFTAEVKFNLWGIKGTNRESINSNLSLKINSSKPEAAFARSIAELLNTTSDPLATYESFEVEILADGVEVVVPESVTNSATLMSDIAQHLRLVVTYRLDCGVDVNEPVKIELSSLAPNAVQLANSKVVTFSWHSADTLVAGYQLELIRLYNIANPDTIVNETTKAAVQAGTAIFAEIDWSKALRLETQSSDRKVSFTLAEGTGYYAWRVRPVGSFYEGGAANHLNYGTWSSDKVEGIKQVALIGTSAIPKDLLGRNVTVFYFEDRDENLNYIYSRTFSEGNRLSESISYATGLQHVKQTQKYLPSQQTNVTSQTIYDHTGRQAITTLPVPDSNATGLEGYKSKFVKPIGSDRVYKATDFDEESNLRTPAQVDQANTAFGYYGGSGNIADAEGYPFQRTIYANDGTGRVIEQSGAGKTHMIGSQAAGSGRTVRTMYATATEQELVSLFGKEAPTNGSVVKTITVDQNNIASVTYTSKEGHVIATSLAFQDTDSTGFLNPLQESSTNPVMSSIKDYITTNTSTANGIISSKMLALTEATPVKLNYKVNCQTLELLCQKATLDCKYNLAVVVTKLDGPSFVEAQGSALTLPAGWVQNSSHAVSYSQPVSCKEGSDIDLGSLQLPRGEYIIEKQLYPVESNVVVEVAREKIEKQTQPLVNMINGWLDKVTCDNNIDSFYVKVNELDAKLKEAKLQCDGSDEQACLTALKQVDTYYQAELGISAEDTFFTKEHSVELLPLGDPRPQQLVINSTCCKDMIISLDIPALFNCKDLALVDSDNSTKYEVNPYTTEENEFKPDFEGYAYSYFLGCITEELLSREGWTASSGTYPTHVMPAKNDTDALKISFIYHRILKPNMHGWDQPGTLNLMVHHMLKDVYNTDGTNKDGAIVQDRPLPNTDPCGGEEQTDCITVDGVTKCKQYNCNELFKCWVSQLAYLKDMMGNLCPNPSGATVNAESGSYNVSEGVDEGNGGDQSKHDDHINSNIKGNFIMKYIVKRKIKKMSKRFRDMQVGASDPESGDFEPGENTQMKVGNFEYHLVKEFLNCTGYRFAKVITQKDSAPLQADSGSTVDYSWPRTGKEVAYAGADRPYTPSSTWEARANNGTKNLFPYIKDPVYAFKYYEYEESSFPSLEASTCYKDPNKCYDANGQEVDCCPDGNCNFCGIGIIKCSVTKPMWTAGQRLTFFKMLEGYKEPASVAWSDDGLDCQDFQTPGHIDTVDGAPVFITWQDTDKSYYTAQEYETLKSEQFQYNGSVLKTKVELEIESLNKGVVSACEMQRSEFKAMLIDTLQAKCYVIGECKACETDSIITMADIDLLVDVMIDQCKARGMVSTFSCKTGRCRDLLTPDTIIGYKDRNGEEININSLEFGTGSQVDTTCNSAVLYMRKSIDSDLSFETRQGTPQTTIEPGELVVVKECTGEVLSYCEWNKRREVTETILRIDLPSKCEGMEATATICDGVNGGDCPTVQGKVSDNSLPADGQQLPASPGTPIQVKVDIDKEGNVKVNDVERK
jgi:hypothetical protein